jgi:hypothetical protein
LITRDIFFWIFSPTYLLIAASKLDVPFNIELYYDIPSKLLKGCIVEIGIENNGGGIRAFSNSLTLSFKIEFLFYISPIDI